MAFGDGNEITSTGRNVTVQGISGTGALRVGANFLATHFPGNKTVYLPKPSWGNHTPIMKHAGLQVGSYGYYDPTTCGMNFAAACDDIKVGNRETTSVELHLEQKLLMGPGTRMNGPKCWETSTYWDPNFQVWNVRVPSAGTHRSGTQMKGPRYWDPSAWM